MKTSIKEIKQVNNLNLKNCEEVFASRGIFKLNFSVIFGKNPAYLKEFQCSHCEACFTDQDINQNNYILWVLNEVSEITKEDNVYGFGDGKPAYELSFRVKMVVNRICLLEGGNN